MLQKRGGKVLIYGAKFQGDRTVLFPFCIPTDTSLFHIFITLYLRLQEEIGTSNPMFTSLTEQSHLKSHSMITPCSHVTILAPLSSFNIYYPHLNIRHFIHSFRLTSAIDFSSLINFSHIFQYNCYLYFIINLIDYPNDLCLCHDH